VHSNICINNLRQQHAHATDQSNSINSYGAYSPAKTVSPAGYDIVFVSRKILKQGVLTADTLGCMPGVGPYSRFRPCAPGKLLIHKKDGT
jgi:hypothetical protein